LKHADPPGLDKHNCIFGISKTARIKAISWIDDYIKGETLKGENMDVKFSIYTL